MATKPFILGVFVLCFCTSAFATQVTYDGRALKIDGERKIIISGSIHYPRSTPEMWPDLIRKSKEGGLNAIETYVFWNAHEPQRRQYDFSGNLDVIRFLQTVQNEGLYAILRIGPYVCAEWNYGGFPVWLHNMPNIKLRTHNEVFMNEMQNFTTLIVEKVKGANLFASQGGPIIIAQIENEYGNVIGSFGDDGKSYINWCAKLAESFKIDIPWIMCQESDAPSPMINTCNGYYCDQFTPNNANVPKIWTENWTGWYKDWGSRDPHRTAEDLAFAVARFYQLGGTVQNYYMYHGGTNFGRTSGGPYIVTSYDYDAPLDEYGNLNQPKWGHLKQLHLLLRSMEKILTYGVVRKIDYGNMMFGTVYTLNGKSSCFFGNANDTTDITINYEGNSYTIPSWSVSILPDCYQEVYNTAKVNSQTSIMVKEPNQAEDDPYNLKWGWISERFENIKTNLKFDLTTNQLLDQKAVTNDTSDYLWYMTSIHVDGNDTLWSKELTLRVHTSGHIIHAFLNGKHIGTQAANNGKYKFDFEHRIKLKIGQNQLSLLSVTVGLQNYGADFDTAETGIVGPVELIVFDDEGEKITKDLSSNKWFYKIGLHGEKRGLYEVNTRRKWSDKIPSNRMFVWYKTNFNAPLGNDPVVVDLMGLGKGHAWVNGQSIGRYWPSYLADEDGCSFTCDYRGSYNDKKCNTNCGKPTQRWYHIPRSFLKDNDNQLVLFEEFGGTPTLTKFETITVGRICAHAYEGNTLELSCQGNRVITRVRFASFGDPKGDCGSFKKGTCEAAKSLSLIEKACIGRQSCTLDVTENTFGPTGCRFDTRRLAVEAVC